MVAHNGIAVIVDLVGSRRHPDRTAVQQQFEKALVEVNGWVRPIQPLEPTIGDEVQGSYETLGLALRATLMLRLTLQAPLDCRFGFGAGTWEVMGRRGHGPMQDGPAWWVAREAILQAKALELRRHKSLRGWYALDEAVQHEYPSAALINALLLCRDEIVTGMSPRSRRLTLGLLLGRTQTSLAQEEGVSQSAVSQSLQRCGASALSGSMSQFA